MQIEEWCVCGGGKVWVFSGGGKGVFTWDMRCDDFSEDFCLTNCLSFELKSSFSSLIKRKLLSSPRGAYNLQPHRIARISQPIAARMPGHARCRRRRRQRVHVFAALDVGDLEARALVAAAHDVAAIPAERNLFDPALHPRQRALAHPFGCVPQADERVRAPDGQVPARGREIQAEAGRGVRVQ